MINTEAVSLIIANRVRAHEVIFRARHPLPTAPFQRTIIEAFHSLHPRIVIEAFRKAAKSTIAEEALCIGAGLVEFKNALIIGASYDRACERLESVKHELETNRDLDHAFGPLRGSDTWTTDKIVLSNGVVLQAKGAGQDLRGVKHHDQPPDYVVIDDLEDDETVKTPAIRKAMLTWLYKTLLAALVREARVRFIGNRLDPEAVIVKVANDAAWQHHIFPILYFDLKTGEERATWEEGWPLDWCHSKKAELERQGLSEVWSQEYMCEAEAPGAKVFRPEHFVNVVRARVRTWEPTYAMVDPAKSVGKRSATTAIPVWSWVGARLVVWECLIGQWLPDEIIAKIIFVDDLYRPVVLGIEEDALNQFIMQPLRQVTTKDHRVLPLRPMAARKFTQGRGKIDFISSLQPFFVAGEVEFAKPLPELQAQLLSFPKGLIDAPNALAYAPRMRPGALMYDDFTPANVALELKASPLLPVHLALNATASWTSGVLVQYDGRLLKVLADYVEEGDPGQAAGAVVRRAALTAEGRVLRVVVPPKHFDQWQNVGLLPALRRVPIDASMGGELVQGRQELRALFRLRLRDLPAVQVDSTARWTLNGFAGGYCRALNKHGAASDLPEENIYSILLGGLESFCALTRVNRGADEDEGNMRTSADGRRYRSAMVDRSGR